jgi:pyruvate dehydrogenase E2 component (dihydrolipoamide acetyltransferase)
MEFEFKMPTLGENVEAGEVTNILVKEGDTVAQGQDLIEVEAAKAVEPLQSPKAGKVTKVHVRVGDSVPVGAALVTLSVGESAAAPAAEKPKAPPKAAVSRAKPIEEEPIEVVPTAAVVSPGAAVEAKRDPPSARDTAPNNGDNGSRSGIDQPSSGSPEPGTLVPAGPSTRRLARQLGVDLHQVEGSGRGGRITREDVVSSVRDAKLTAQTTTSDRAAPSWGGAVATPQGKDEQDSFGRLRREPMSAVRKTIAAHMAHSSATIPHVTNFDDADITELERIRKGGLADYQGTSVKLTMLPFVLKAVAHALRQHPAVNASLDMERQQILYKEYINIGVAVDTDRGLIVPVLRQADRMSIPQIASATTELIERVRVGKFNTADVQGGTFTISNLGAIGGTYSTPIINHPQVAILLIGRARKLPVVKDDQVRPRLMMPLSLSYDHRLVDGAVAARFLNDVKVYLETPGRLLLAP